MSFRRFAYNIFFRLSPILIVVLLELALRLLGVGDSYVLFNESKNDQSYQLNTLYYRRFLSERQFHNIKVLPQEIDKEKNDQTYRVFLIADQTLFSAYPEVTEKQLVEDIILPDGKTLDIVQLAVPYTNSFVIKRLIKCANRYNADACVILTGQNEFYGLPQKSAWMQDMNNYIGISSYIRMKNHRFIQILDRFLIVKKENETQFPPSNPDEWLVAYESEKYFEIKSYFEKNIKSINKTSKCPLFYVVLPPNIKSPPYRSGFDDKELNDNKIIKECAVLLANSDPFNIERWIDDLKAWEPETGIYYYCKAMIEEHQNNKESAFNFYTKALEHDDFRVRMDDQFKHILEINSDQENIELIDLNKRLEDMSNSKLSVNRYYFDGLELNVNGKDMLVSEIKSTLISYFSKK